ncbi:hypothetical protein HDV05_003550 [Chytridiales sp. JEL 0842]|nr:hypothetical protein HDV05_003550 [Chytridiales sp. JEL 0842]
MIPQNLYDQVLAIVKSADLDKLTEKKVRRQIEEDNNLETKLFDSEPYKAQLKECLNRALAYVSNGGEEDEYDEEDEDTPNDENDEEDGAPDATASDDDKGDAGSRPETKKVSKRKVISDDEEEDDDQDEEDADLKSKEEKRPSPTKKPKKEGTGSSNATSAKSANTNKPDKSKRELNERDGNTPESAKTTLAKSSKGKVAPTTKSSSDEDVTEKQAKEIDRLKGYVLKCGVRKLWGVEFKGLDGKARIAKLKDILSSLGLTDGRPTLKKCKQIKARREMEQELAGLETSNIISERRGARLSGIGKAPPKLLLEIGVAMQVYEEDEQVVVWVNGIGSYSNSQETYDYFQLPYCAGPNKVLHHHESLAEALLGVNLINSGIDVSFAKNVSKATICSTTVDKRGLELFKYAITQDYWYQMFIDDIPIYEFVGKVLEDDVVALYTKRDFIFKYNTNQIIGVDIEQGNLVQLPVNDGESIDLEFVYSVTWIPTDEPFSTRSKNPIKFFEHKIHWFSIFNSFMMVVFLMGLVIVILLRTLKRDLARYDREEFLLDGDRDFIDEYGWKQIHGDVFRAPGHLTFFSSLLGTGLHLFVIAIAVMVYAATADFQVQNSHTLSAGLFFYALTSTVSGYFSGSYYTKNGGKNWVRLIFVTAGLWPAVLATVVLLVNFLAIAKTSTRAIPFGSMMAVLSIWLFCVFPLCVIGVILGRNWAGNADFPCRVNPIPRPIPDKAWYAEPPMIILLSGLLPFGSIFIEIYYIFTSFWGYKTYYVFGFMLLVFLILVIVTACVSIVSTYFLLNSENHQWNWIAFFASGSTAGYVFLYSIYYFYARTTMHGIFQTSWYFAYTALACFSIFLMLGFVGHFSASRFIRTIYKNLKID